ncbi:hypothetical protein C8034_v005773 [Colletotrichum sidae]|uniref:N-acetyltransferase B complex non catalytic subunit n=1 Tax=Colletotrichum sidae TaxID=1347389 RepID=A0A4R8T5Z5_9PEZI|nr:hypothetical protein C8034_v005773 [Colletotrichum sidae]
MSWNRPQLRSGVDLQLQSAFNDGQWANVIRLAEKRFRTFNDPYYETVKIVAESRLESPVEKASPLIAVQKLVKDASAIRDVESLDLLEWASGDFIDDREFADIFGPLKLRYVKANPKDRKGGVRCLESSLLHWDLNSAQQIAAVLDKSFPQERCFLFWNIALTHLLATSDQCPHGKKQLYGMLALKQMQRAAQFAEQHAGSEKNGDTPVRAIKTEEEILLLYSIMEAHASDAEWEAALRGSTLNPVYQFKTGRKDLFLQTIGLFERKGQWKTVYDLCKECLSVTDEKNQLSLLACDWAVWKKFLHAAGQLGDSSQQNSAEVSSLIDRFLTQENVRSIYKRNIYLARVEAAFQFAHLVQSKPEDKSNEYQELCRYIDIECASPACFDDVRGFVERLPPQEIRELAYEYVVQIAEQSEDTARSASVKTLAFKLQYLGLSSSKTVVRVRKEESTGSSSWKCIVCAAVNNSSTCTKCVKRLLASTLTLYSSLINSSDISPTLDCIPELAILTATACVRLSGLHERDVVDPTALSKRGRHDRLLQAALIIEDQLTRTPKHTRLTLVLVRIYLVLGCASRAREVWDTADVKRTIIDSLGPYFFDRLSTIAPALVVPPNRRGLMDGLKAHYNTSLLTRMPKRVPDAFDAESYTAILNIPNYIERLRKSCTVVMGYVEDARAGRALGLRGESIFDQLAIDEIVDETVLNDVIDYGSVPNFESVTSRPIYDVLRLGPDPSNVRSHLALGAEQFFEILSFKMPASYKVANVAQVNAVEQTYVFESLQRLNTSMSRFLHSRGKNLTVQEEMFYDIIALLTSLIPLTIAVNRSTPPSEVLPSIVSAIKSGLEVLRAQSLSTPPEAEDSKVLLILGSLHGLSILRDTASAVKLATSYITTFNEKEKERDRSGQSNIPKDVMADVKALETAAVTAMKEGKDRVALLKKEGQTLNARLSGWTFEGEVDDELAKQIREVAGPHVDTWTQKVAESWKTNVKGWELVRWE